MTMLKRKNPIIASIEERSELYKIEDVLQETLKKNEGNLPRLIGANNEEIILPHSVFDVLVEAVHLMAQGKAFSFVRIDKELTTQEAADILNVSRPFLIKLLEGGEIPFIKVASHRRIRFIDLLAYQKERDRERHKILTELTQYSEEIGLYDEDEEMKED